VWLRVRILNSLVFSFSTTVRAIRDSLREASRNYFKNTSHVILACPNQNLALSNSSVPVTYTDPETGVCAWPTTRNKR